MIVYDNRADMIHHVRSDHSRNKSKPVHEKSSFPKDCDEYTTKRLVRQAFSAMKQKVQNPKKKKSARFGKNGSAVFLLWKIWYDQKGMVGMIIAVSSEAEECENVNVPETEEYLTA